MVACSHLDSLPSMVPHLDSVTKCGCVLSPWWLMLASSVSPHLGSVTKYGCAKAWRPQTFDQKCVCLCVTLKYGPGSPSHCEGCPAKQKVAWVVLALQMPALLVPALLLLQRCCAVGGAVVRPPCLLCRWDAAASCASEKLYACTAARGAVVVPVAPLLQNARGVTLMVGSLEESLEGFEIALEASMDAVQQSEAAGRGLCSGWGAASGVGAPLANRRGAGAKNVEPCCSSLNTVPCSCGAMCGGTLCCSLLSAAPCTWGAKRVAPLYRSSLYAVPRTGGVKGMGPWAASAPPAATAAALRATGSATGRRASCAGPGGVGADSPISGAAAHAPRGRTAFFAEPADVGADGADGAI
eukprot:1156531-Pelagomonas_calceolata.AAC.6